MGALSELLNFFKGYSEPLPTLHFLPSPPAPKSKGVAPKKQSGLFVIDEQRDEFGFHSDKEADKNGAATWLTNYDKDVLRERGLFGVTKGVQEQNATCKRLWATGVSVADCERDMKVSASWIEKRFACFSTALSEERGEG